MSHDPQEFQIPLIFDVTAYSRDEAGDALVKILHGHQLPGNRRDEGPAPHARIESWWTLEVIDKAHDGNDNEHGVVVFQHDLDYLLALLVATGGTQQPPGFDFDGDRHDRLMSYFAPDHRIGSDDYRDEDGY